MTIVSDLMQLGFNPEQAKHLGDDVVTGISAAGSGGSAALQLTGTVNVVTSVTSTNHGVKLPAASDHARKIVVVINATATTDQLTVYPQATDTIQGAWYSAGVGTVLPSLKTYVFYRTSDTNWETDVNWTRHFNPTAFEGTVALEGAATFLSDITYRGEKITDWQAWTPTYGGSGSMTYESVTTFRARYAIVGKMIILALRTTAGEIKGTVSTGIRVSSPKTLSNNADGPLVACMIKDGGTFQAGYTGYASSTTIGIGKINNANWTLGTGTTIALIVALELA